MTLTETEETLHTLINRHPGLDDSMLVTLLRSGGWEEKEIQVARTLFREGGGVVKDEHSPYKSLPPLQEAPTLPQEVQYDHLLTSAEKPQTETSPSPSAPIPLVVVEKGSEPQSLTQSVLSEAHMTRDELPHDLPLRPFETSDHIWPFSRYRDVFYGEVDHGEAVTPVSLPVVESRESPVTPVSEVKSEVVKIARSEPVFRPLAPRTSEIQTPGDDKLVIIACAMLVAVLFVLGYMYSNGRL